MNEPSTDTYTWKGQQLLLWTFQHWKTMEDFLDELCPEAYVAEIRYELHKEGLVTGFIYSKDPLVPPNIVAAYRITDPEPQPGFEDSTGGS